MAIKKIRMRPEDNNDYADILHPETSADLVIDLDRFGSATGTNAYSVTIGSVPQLYTGLRVTVSFANANTGGASLNVNGLGAKTIIKAGGAALTSGNIKAGSIQSLVYNGTSFQLLGEGGEYGTAQASHVLSPYTVGTDNGLITGTMTNRAGNNNALNVARSGTTLRLRAPNGYYDGVDDTVQTTSADWLVGNILEGKNVFGLVGTLAEGKKWASGRSDVTVESPYGNSYLQVTNLDFEPSVVIMYDHSNYRLSQLLAGYAGGFTYHCTQGESGLMIHKMQPASHSYHVSQGGFKLRDFGANAYANNTGGTISWIALE